MMIILILKSHNCDFTNLFFFTISGEQILTVNEKINVYIQEVTIYDLSNKSHHTSLHLKFNILDFTLWTHLDPTFRQRYIHLRQQRKSIFFSLQ